VKELRGRRALVTGAASGIGRALAGALFRAGAELELVDRDETGLARVATDLGRARTRRCDLAREVEVAACAEAILADGGPDLLVNCAGVAWVGSTRELPADELERLLSVNLLAPVRLTRALLPALLARGDAHVVNVCSIAGLVGLPRLAAYSASKFGLVGWSQALAREYRGRLGVTAVCPGFVATPMLEASGARRPPRLLLTSPDRVAARTLRAVVRGRRRVVISPLAHVLFAAERWLPEAAMQRLLGRG
jgi:short-subunit dehydrogenase